MMRFTSVRGCFFWKQKAEEITAETISWLTPKLPVQSSQDSEEAGSKCVTEKVRQGPEVKGKEPEPGFWLGRGKRLRNNHQNH